MHISKRQIETVIKTLKNNKHKLADGYLNIFNSRAVLEEISIEIIKNLNKVIYNGT